MYSGKNSYYSVLGLWLTTSTCDQLSQECCTVSHKALFADTVPWNPPSPSLGHLPLVLMTWVEHDCVTLESWACYGASERMCSPVFDWLLKSRFSLPVPQKWNCHYFSLCTSCISPCVENGLCVNNRSFCFIFSAFTLPPWISFLD